MVFLYIFICFFVFNVSALQASFKTLNDKKQNLSWRLSESQVLISIVGCACYMSD